MRSKLSHVNSFGDDPEFGKVGSIQMHATVMRIIIKTMASMFGIYTSKMAETGALCLTMGQPSVGAGGTPNQ